ncbi:hypothetical protein C8R21_12519 [Nitrosospira multiformis]|uniref:Uncharacterized protein n=2 Tax=Nitrosospira multiformis TaxID=1231 RepID=A0A2T5I6X5_9PROT|nr:hypothetical protein C8R21_12519 [Nitrosospira multiformis]
MKLNRINELPSRQYTPKAAVDAAASPQPPLNKVLSAAGVVPDMLTVFSKSIGRGSNAANMDVSTILTRDQIQKSSQIFLDQLMGKELGIWTRQIRTNQLVPTAAMLMEGAYQRSLKWMRRGTSSR